MLLGQHEFGVEQLALTDDGRVVTGGWDGRVYCARLGGGEPVLLAQHEGGVEQLVLTGDGRVIRRDTMRFSWQICLRRDSAGSS